MTSRASLFWGEHQFTGTQEAINALQEVLYQSPDPEDVSKNLRIMVEDWLEDMNPISRKKLTDVVDAAFPPVKYIGALAGRPTSD